MSNWQNTFTTYLHIADTVRASQTKWIGVFNRLMTLNRLTEDRSPLM